MSHSIDIYTYIKYTLIKFTICTLKQQIHIYTLSLHAHMQYSESQHGVNLLTFTTSCKSKNQTGINSDNYE